MVDVFLYQNPVAPAVVGLFVFAILGWYWMTRKEVALGERAEGPPAAHPFALLVQSLLVLAKDRKLPAIVLVICGLAMVARWPAEFRLTADSDIHVGFWGGLDRVRLALHLQSGRAALEAVSQGLPGQFPVLQGGLLHFPLAVLLSGLLVSYCSRRPAWLSGRRRAKSLWIGWGCLASALVGTTYGWWWYQQYPDVGTALDWPDSALLLASLPASTLAMAYAHAAVLELVVSRKWNLSLASRRVVDAYFQWLGFALITTPITSALIIAHWGETSWEASWLDQAAWRVTYWLPVVFFALPWVLLDRERGLWEGLRRSIRFIWDNVALVLVFSVRLAAILAPASYVLSASRAAFQWALVPDLLHGMLRQFISIVAAMTVCRAYVSIAHRDELAPESTSAGGSSAGAE